MVVVTASTVKSQVIDLQTALKKGNLEVEEHVSGAVTRVTSLGTVQTRPMGMAEVVVVVVEEGAATGVGKRVISLETVQTRPEGAAEVVLGVVRRGI